MPEISQHYTLNLMTLSPLHVGTGQELLRDYDYAVRNGRTWRIDEDALLDAALGEGEFDEALLRRPAAELLQPADFRPDSGLFRYVVKGAPRSGQKGARLREQIKNVFDQPYLPGSSLKGAFRSAIFDWALAQNPQALDTRRLKDSRKWAAQPIEQALLGRNPNYDLLRALHVSDSVPLPPKRQAGPLALYPPVRAQTWPGRQTRLAARPDDRLPGASDAHPGRRAGLVCQTIPPLARHRLLRPTLRTGSQSARRALFAPGGLGRRLAQQDRRYAPERPPARGGHPPLPSGAGQTPDGRLFSQEPPRRAQRAGPYRRPSRLGADRDEGGIPMTVLLLANIGNRDVWMGKETPISGEVNPRWNKDASRRALGQALQADWTACQPHLDLPIIGKAVNYVRQQSGQLDLVALISSDQSGQEGVSEYHLAQDTCELATVVERLLIEQYGLAASAVTHWTVTSNPADYGDMRAFFQERLAMLRHEQPNATFYLEVSGGTPAMTSMLLTVGAEIFGLDAHPLYVSEHEDRPFPLDIGRRTVADALVKTVKANLDIYAYHAAANTVRDNRDLLREFIPADPLLAVLEYARQRVNFNFAQAGAALSGLYEDDWSERLSRLKSELDNERAEWLLHEIVYNAEIKQSTGAYGDFLTRVFRFDEAALRHTARSLGACLVDKQDQPDADGEFLDNIWIGSEPNLDAYLESKNVRRNNLGKISANRYVLSLIVSFLSKRRGDPTPKRLLKQLGNINKLSGVRNKSFAVHTFEGVSRQRIAQAFLGQDAIGTNEEIAQVMRTLKDACETTTNQPFDDTNPYDAINDLILEILAA